ncbi:MAG: hypothetical protein LBH37_03295 [Oscillospiraceae bacterium]|jgi:hypothetical protein|nr:hypothetical protein [Oscillospiraceae bacterium]
MNEIFYEKYKQGEQESLESVLGKGNKVTWGPQKNYFSKRTFFLNLVTGVVDLVKLANDSKEKFLEIVVSETVDGAKEIYENYYKQTK